MNPHAQAYLMQLRQQIADLEKSQGDHSLLENLKVTMKAVMQAQRNSVEEEK